MGTRACKLVRTLEKVGEIGNTRLDPARIRIGTKALSTLYPPFSADTTILDDPNKPICQIVARDRHIMAYTIAEQTR